MQILYVSPLEDPNDFQLCAGVSTITMNHGIINLHIPISHKKVYDKPPILVSPEESNNAPFTFLNSNRNDIEMDLETDLETDQDKKLDEMMLFDIMEQMDQIIVH